MSEDVGQELSQEKVVELLKRATVYVDVNNNAVVLSLKRIIAFFISNLQGVDRITKVQLDGSGDFVVYATLRPTSQYVKSLVLKVVVRKDFLNLQGFKYEIEPQNDDVYVRVYANVSDQSELNISREDEEEF